MIQTNNLILIGGGGHCKSVIDVAESAGYNILGIFDKPENVGRKILGYTIIGSDNNISDYISKALFIVTVGQIKDPSVRIMIHNKIYNSGGRMATLIANTAHVSKYCEIGEGSIIMHHAVVNADSKIGKGCIINTFANIEHDVTVGDYCHISTGAMINGKCTVGAGSFIGSQSVLVNGIIITEDCIVAAGAVIIENISLKGIYAGNPAKLKI